MTNQITPLILSGGSGSRLWPLSTPERPKQFLRLHGDKTMIAQTLCRVGGRDRFAPPILIGAVRHQDLLLQALDDANMKDGVVILEPCARNTAPAIALGALEAGRDSLVLVMPSDHVILDVPAFHAAVERAVPAANAGQLVTFGIEPSGPETGFGYIQTGEVVVGMEGVFRSMGFTEKPDIKRAEKMLSTGDHFWNAGIFLFRADAFLIELERLQPEMHVAAREAMVGASRQDNFIVPNKEDFASSPSNSIDYAVMEQAQHVTVVPVSCGWSDVGSWDALADIAEADEHGNTLIGDSTTRDCSGVFSNADGLRINAVGLKNMIIVASSGEVLVVPRGQSQRVKDIKR